MFFRVLSAILTADAIDRRIRTQQPRYWYRLAPSSDEADIGPARGQLRPDSGAFSAVPAWDPRAPERPR